MAGCVITAFALKVPTKKYLMNLRRMEGEALLKSKVLIICDGAYGIIIHYTEVHR
jgi:hypothetical protein